MSSSVSFFKGITFPLNISVLINATKKLEARIKILQVLCDKNLYCEVEVELWLENKFNSI